MRRVLAPILALAGIMTGFIVGALHGMYLFGNFFVHATFLKVRGYEAGFWYGGIAGGLAGLWFGVWLYRVVCRRCHKG